ncbi:MAG: DMT family transporter [Bacteroidales bacterium]
MYVYILAILSMLFWGMSFVWSSIVFQYYPPVTTVFLRLVISAALLFAGIKLFGRMEGIVRKDYKLFFLSALFNPFLYFLGESYGLKYSSPTISAVVIATIPLFTPVAAYYILGEKLRIMNIIGIVISFAGIIVMLANKDFIISASPSGIAFLLFAVGSAIAYSVYLKRLSKKYSAVFIIAVQNLLGAIYFFPVFLLLDFNEFISVPLNFRLVSSLLALAIFCSSLAYVFFTISTREIGISKTNIFANLIPVFTAVFSYFILAEYFNAQKIAGMAIVLLGLYLSQINKRPRPVQYTG